MSQQHESKVTTMSLEIEQLRARCGRVFRDETATSEHPSTSSAYSVPANSNVSKGLQFTKFRDFDFTADSRVGAYNDWLNMLVISQSAKTPLYPRKFTGAGFD